MNVFKKYLNFMSNNLIDGLCLSLTTCLGIGILIIYLGLTMIALYKL